jgi:hypothetical protein
MNEIHKNKLSLKEKKEVEEFVLYHPYTKVADLIQNCNKIIFLTLYL